jgi:hypothetical protein
VLRPLREEVSTIKLWIARVANHLEGVDPCGEHASVFNIAELFGPCSPVRRSPTTSVPNSLAAACTLDDSLVREATFANTTNFIIDDVRQKIPDMEIYREMGPVTNEMTTRMFDNAESSTAQTEQAIAEVASSVEDVIHVEDASDDEDVLYAQVKVENPIFLITIEDGSTHSTEARVEEPRLVEDPPVASSPSTIVVKAPCSPIHPSSPARRQCKVYDRSSLCRSVRLAQRGVLSDLGIVGNDGKKTTRMQFRYAECLQRLLPPDLLTPLMSLKGRAFWDMVTEVSLHLS